MRTLSGNDEREALGFLAECRKAAQKATCLRAKCGSVIVKDGTVIGRGFNSPPADLDSQRRCMNEKTAYDPKVTDKTCCIHAEQRAIMDALKNNASLLPGARLYFARLADDGETAFSGKPYCTVCSKMALDAGIAEFVLWHAEGITVYGTAEYNDLSFAYHAPE